MPAIDAEHHVARYCGHQKLVAGIDPTAFELRQGTATRPAEDYLSVNHCEHHNGTRLQQLRKILGDLTAKNYTWKSSGGFAVLKTSKVIDCGKQRNRNLRVRTRPHPQDPSYTNLR